MGLSPGLWTWTPSPCSIWERRPVPAGDTHLVRLLPELAVADSVTGVLFGDTGDADMFGSRDSPQCALARLLCEEARSRNVDFLVHTGDLVYPTGEARLYPRNFLEPYASLIAGADPDGLIKFRLPFLAVPGNHDYGEFAAWAAAVARLPVVGPLFCDVCRRVFAFNLPQGGSGLAEGFFRHFVRPTEAGREALPHRYYAFQTGPVDWFALDSNTLTSSEEEQTDQAQLSWLEQSLSVSAAARPEAWRVLLLHHPLITQTRGYSRSRGIANVRRHLMPILRSRVDLLVSGHAHAFEWLETATLPSCPQLITGGGGQPTLRRSLLEPGPLAGVPAEDLTSYLYAGHRAGTPPVYHFLVLEGSRELLRLTPRGMAWGQGRGEAVSPLPAGRWTRGNESGWNVGGLASITLRKGRAPEVDWRP